MIGFVQFATNKHYGLPTGLVDEREDSASIKQPDNAEDDQKTMLESNGMNQHISKQNSRSIGIYKHCVIIDMDDMSATVCYSEF